jgi:CRP/FNR family transcriptional regulator
MDTEGIVELTHQELSVIIGTAREVVSRRLEALASKGLIENERGHIRLIQIDQLKLMAASR